MKTNKTCITSYTSEQYLLLYSRTDVKFFPVHGNIVSRTTGKALVSERIKKYKQFNACEIVERKT